MNDNAPLLLPPPRLRRQAATSPLEMRFDRDPVLMGEINAIANNIDALREANNLPPHPEDHLFRWKLERTVEALVEREANSPRGSAMALEARRMIETIQRLQRENPQ